MTFLRRSTVICVLAVMTTSSLAQELAFHHSGGLSPMETDRGLYSAWNPSGSKELLSPGVKVVFFGSAPGCDSTMNAGPVSTSSRYSGQELAQDTGLPRHEEIESEVLTPATDPKHCTSKRERQRDGSFVVRGSPEGNSGVGLYTTIGPDTAGRHPLIDTFDSKGQGGSGANVGIAGTFVLFRFDWEKGSSPNLWPNTQSKDGHNSVLELQTTQTLATASLGNTSDSPDAPVKQAKQQVTMTLINRECRRVLAQSGKSCQVQYLLTLAIVRSGVKDWSNVDWFQAARIWIDPAQGSIPVVDGPIRGKGQVTRDASRKFELYTSDGDESAHNVFNDRRFRIRIGFNQFQNALRLATAIQMKRAPEAVSYDDVAHTFGPKFHDPASWTLVDVEVGQEIYNGKPDSEAHIGGSFKEIGIGPSQSLAAVTKQ